MNGLLQQVVASLDGGAIEQLAGRMGVSPAQAQGAAAGALPSLLDALGQRGDRFRLVAGGSIFTYDLKLRHILLHNTV